METACRLDTGLLGIEGDLAVRVLGFAALCCHLFSGLSF